MNKDIQQIAGHALALLGKGGADLRELGEYKGVIPASIHKLGKNIILLTREKGLLVVADHAKVMAAGFEGERFSLSDGGAALLGPRSALNAAALRRHFPWCVPAPFRKKEYVAEGLPLRDCAGRIFPIYYECDRAVFQIFAEDFREGYGVATPLIAKFDELDKACMTPASFFRFQLGGGTGTVTGVGAVYNSVYSGKCFVLSGTDDISFDEAFSQVLAGQYHGSLEFVRKAYGVLRTRRGASFDLGVFLPEYASPEEHLFVLRELRKRGIDFAVLGPGCTEGHWAVGRAYGGYKLIIPSKNDRKVRFYSGAENGGQHGF